MASRGAEYLDIYVKINITKIQDCAELRRGKRRQFVTMFYGNAPGGGSGYSGSPHGRWNRPLFGPRCVEGWRGWREVTVRSGDASSTTRGAVFTGTVGQTRWASGPLRGTQHLPPPKHIKHLLPPKHNKPPAVTETHRIPAAAETHQTPAAAETHQTPCQTPAAAWASGQAGPGGQTRPVSAPGAYSSICIYFLILPIGVSS